MVNDLYEYINSISYNVYYVKSDTPNINFIFVLLLPNINNL